MHQRTHAMLFSLHSWAGVLTGVLMFVVCFSGSIVVFKNEIDVWANPSLKLDSLQGRPAPVDVVMAGIASRYPGSRIEAVVLPGATNPGYYLFIRESDGKRTKIAAQGSTGEIIGPVDSELGQFIRALHVFLFFGPRWIVGALGVVMLALIVTGFLIHRKIIQELFTQRWTRSFRVLTSDLHKALGIWGLLFHIVIAFTGAWLGLAPLVERAAGFVGGASAAESRPRPNPTPAPMASVDSLLVAARGSMHGFEPRFIGLRDWGSTGAVASIHGNLVDHLASTARMTFSGVTGAILDRRDPRERGFWSQVNGIMEPLHFGDFGGIWLKWLYFLLGLSPALISLTGTLLWLDRRKRRAGVPTAGQAAQHA